MTVFKVNNRPVAKSWNGIVNDLFNDFENNFSTVFNQPNGAAKTPVNISETENAYHLDILAAGRKKELFVVNVEKDILTVSYETKEQESDNANLKSIRNEFVVNGFKRSFTLDEKVNAEAIEAKYEDGILKLTLPKKAEVKPEVKQITIG
jgi:HSP20 family protein